VGYLLNNDRLGHMIYYVLFSLALTLAYEVIRFGTELTCASSEDYLITIAMFIAASRPWSADGKRDWRGAWERR